MTLPTETPEADSDAPMQLDIYMSTGQHYQVIVPLYQVWDVQRLWRSAIKGEGQQNTIMLSNELEPQIVEARLVYISSITFKPTESISKKSKIEIN